MIAELPFVAAFIAGIAFGRWLMRDRAAEFEREALYVAQGWVGACGKDAEQGLIEAARRTSDEERHRYERAAALCDQARLERAVNADVRRDVGVGG